MTTKKNAPELSVKKNRTVIFSSVKTRQNANTNDLSKFIV